MLKIKSKYFSKLFILIAIFANLFNIASPLLLTVAYAQETSDQTTIEEEVVEVEEVVAEDVVVEEETESQDETEPVTESTDEVVEAASEEELIEQEETPEVVSNETIVEEVIVEETVEANEEETQATVEEENEEPKTQILDENDSIETLSANGWEINEDENVAETKEDVKLGIKYEFPLDDKVSITFQSLPGDEDKLSKLKIERLKTSELNFPDTDKNYGEFSYDITTDMENGTFEYELSLPNVGEDVEVVYVEKSIEDAKSEGISEEDVKSVNEDDVELKDEVVTVEDLDHFTIFTTINQNQTEVDVPEYTGTRICHATEGVNGFVSQSPNNAGQLNGHVGDDHMDGRDIIPPVPFYLPEGQNWDELGQAIWNKDCSEDITKIVINKTTEGGDDTFGFNLTSTEAEVSEEFDITTDGGEGTYRLYVPIGNDFVLTEDSKEGWVMLSNSCSEPFSLVKGQTVTCDIVNEEKSIQTQCLEGVNMLVNGDFESPVVSHSAKWDIYPSSNPSIGWDVSWLAGAASYNSVTRPENAHVELHRGVNGWNPEGGSQYAELDSDWDGPSGSLNGEPASVSLKQTLGTIPGYNYEIKYYFSARPGTTLNDNKLVTNWDGILLGSHTATTGGNTDWTPFIYTKTATNNTTEIEFKDDGASNSLGTFLDEVSVTCLGPSETTVTGMKYNDANGNGVQDDGENELEGWTIKAVEANPVDTVVVDSKLIGGNNSSLLTAGDYMIVVNGTFEYKSLATNMYYADAEYSTVDAWSNHLDGATGYTGAGDDSNDIMIGTDFIEWGPFDSVSNTYYANYEIASDQELNFSVFDGDVDTDVKNPGWYGDNDGSVTVSIYKVVDVDVTDSDGKYELSIPSEYESNVRVYEIPQRGWMQTAPSNPNYCDVFPQVADNFRVTQIDDAVLPENGRVCNFGNTQVQEQSRTYQIHATKIVCTDEEQLPDWGLGGPDITVTTAQDWVNTHNTCSFASDWEFQYNFNGESNPGDNLSTPAGAPWTSFPTVTDANGTTTVTLSEEVNYVDVREVLKEGYLGFTYNETVPGNNENDVSAEIYCHSDVINYDNRDIVHNPEVGNDYYCVAFNVLEELQCVEEPGWADVSVSSEQGKTKVGGNVLANRSNLDNVFDEPDFEPTDNAVNTFFALGFGGTATLEFSRQVLNVDGNDLSFHEGTNGNRNSYPEETALIEVSQNGTDWYEVGTVTGRSTDGGSGVDLVDFGSTGLNWIKFVRVTDTSNSALFENTADGYDLDAIDATMLGCGDLPEDEVEPEEFLTISATKVVCTDETELPNWGLGGENITATTAQNWIAGHESCSLQPGWEFQYAVDGFLNPGDNFSTPAGDPWESLPLTNDSGVSTVKVTTLGSQIEFREVLKEGYLGFTYNNYNPKSNENNVSAEIYCADDVVNYDNFDIIRGPQFDQTYYCVAFNTLDETNNEQRAQLTIEKFNNVNDGAILSHQGDNVKFTITVKALLGSLTDVVVTDLPPLGFDPLEDSFKVTSSVHGDLAIADPTYASPGDWNLGNMEEDEEIIIEYEARISDSQQAGLYKTLAYAQGNQGETENTVLAQALSVGNIGDENFVGTAILVDVESDAPEAESNVDVDEKVEIKEVGSVLGASTMPATGSNFGFTLFGASLVLLGLLVRFRRFFKKPVQIALFTLALSVFAVTKVNASTLNARLYEPNDNVNSTFKLDFVVLSMNQSDGVIVDCYVKRPGEGSFSVFQTVNLIAGGTSSTCDVNNSVLTTSSLTPYEFYIEATQGVNNATSGTVDTRYDSAGPNKPEDFDVDRDNECEYDIEFKTANDGQTAKVEVYRSTNDVFPVNDSTRVKTIVIGPNTEHSFTDTVAGVLCGEVNYYALRAFDSAGNASDVANQDYDETSTKTVTVSTTSSEGNEGGTAGTGGTTGGIGGAILIEEGSGAVATPTDEEGAVAGTTDEEGNSIDGLEIIDTDDSEDDESNPSVLGDTDKPFNWWIVLGILGAGIVGYVGYKYFARK